MATTLTHMELDSASSSLSGSGSGCGSTLQSPAPSPSSSSSSSSLFPYPFPSPSASHHSSSDIDIISPSSTLSHDTSMSSSSSDIPMPTSTSASPSFSSPLLTSQSHIPRVPSHHARIMSTPPSHDISPLASPLGHLTLASSSSSSSARTSPSPSIFQPAKLSFSRICASSPPSMHTLQAQPPRHPHSPRLSSSSARSSTSSSPSMSHRSSTSSLSSTSTSTSTSSSMSYTSRQPLRPLHSIRTQSMPSFHDISDDELDTESDTDTCSEYSHDEAYAAPHIPHDISPTSPSHALCFSSYPLSCYQLTPQIEHLSYVTLPRTPPRSNITRQRSKRTRSLCLFETSTSTSTSSIQNDEQDGDMADDVFVKRRVISIVDQENTRGDGNVGIGVMTIRSTPTSTSSTPQKNNISPATTSQTCTRKPLFSQLPTLHQRTSSLALPRSTSLITYHTSHSASTSPQPSPSSSSSSSSSSSPLFRRRTAHPIFNEKRIRASASATPTTLFGPTTSTSTSTSTSAPKTTVTSPVNTAVNATSASTSTSTSAAPAPAPASISSPPTPSFTSPLASMLSDQSRRGSIPALQLARAEMTSPRIMSSPAPQSSPTFPSPSPTRSMSEFVAPSPRSPASMSRSRSLASPASSSIMSPSTQTPRMNGLRTPTTTPNGASTPTTNTPSTSNVAMASPASTVLSTTSTTSTSSSTSSSTQFPDPVPLVHSMSMPARSSSPPITATSPTLDDDWSPQGVLPTVSTGFGDGVRRIDACTLNQLLAGEYRSCLDHFIIIDCRYRYEYDGGHIRGAIHINTRDGIEALYAANAKCSRRVALVFHCEFSKNRAPEACKLLRDCDRKQNTWPTLTFPDLYVLDGGYSRFYLAHPSSCIPDAYVSMWDARFQLQCKRETGRHRRSWKPTKAIRMNSTQEMRMIRSTSEVRYTTKTTTTTTHEEEEEKQGESQFDFSVSHPILPMQISSSSNDTPTDSTSSTSTATSTSASPFDADNSSNNIDPSPLTFTSGSVTSRPLAPRACRLSSRSRSAISLQF